MKKQVRTGEWVLRHGRVKGDGVYWRDGDGPHLQIQKTARRWPSKELALRGLCVMFFGGPWRAVALTRRAS